MDQYKKRFQEKLKPQYDQNAGEMKVDPFKGAQEALAKAVFVSREREEFFNQANTDILAELFVTWLKSAPHAVKEREYLYSCAMALGSIKQYLIGIELAAKNAKFMNNQRDVTKTEDDGESKGTEE